MKKPATLTLTISERDAVDVLDSARDLAHQVYSLDEKIVTAQAALKALKEEREIAVQGTLHTVTEGKQQTLESLSEEELES